MQQGRPSVELHLTRLFKNGCIPIIMHVTAAGCRSRKSMAGSIADAADRQHHRRFNQHTDRA